MLLTHRGRKSGRLYETVLEVPVYHRRTRTSYVMSGWGDKADWYRNIEVQPAVRVQIGRDSYAPAQHVLSPQEVVRVWEEFRRRHPIEEKIALRLYSQPGHQYCNDQDWAYPALVESENNRIWACAW
jgi:deazaflavin-dependent oxidoreductase (nitroreductase family)